MNSQNTKELKDFIDKSTRYKTKYYQLNNRYQLIIGCCLMILSFILLGVLIFINDLAVQQVLVAIAGLLIISALDIFKSVRAENKMYFVTPPVKPDNSRNIQIINGYYVDNEGNKISHDTSNQNQIVIETAAEIQKLLNHISKTHSTNTTQEKMVIAAEVVDEIENTPTLKERVVSAVKAGGIVAFENILTHPAAAITVAALSGWQSEPETKIQENKD